MEELGNMYGVDLFLNCKSRVPRIARETPEVFNCKGKCLQQRGKPRLETGV